MESNISSICPAAFSGTSGGLFLNALTAVIAAHCSIFDDYRWPPDSSHLILEDKDPSYDFVIIGAGSAGSLVAGLLSKSNVGSVLLIEAGDDPGLDSEIPAFLFLNQNSDIDWHYTTLPSTNSCLGFVNNSCIWSKGKGMGGSSSINAMIYTRGHPKDYEYWESLKTPGWNYEDLVQYFLRQEQVLNLTNNNKQTFNNPWYEIIDKAWKELGFCDDSYTGDESLIGARQVKLVTRNGKRLNTAKAYLEGATKLHIMKNTVANRIILDKHIIAVSVEVRNKQGKLKTIRAAKEIILSAGSIATPQLLMQSGIGPKKHLDSIGIDSILHLPVGENLQDHILFPLYLKTNMNAELPMDIITNFLLQYMLTRTGPFSTIGITDFTSFIDSKNTSDYPDIQFHHTYFTKNDHFTLRPYLEGIGYTREIIEAVESLNNKHDLLGIYPTLLHPKSRGQILLSKFSNQPIIKTNYLTHPDDMNALLRAIEFIHKLEKTNTFKSLGLEILHLRIPNCSKYSFDSNDYWTCYIRHMATTIYHPVGTCKMGSKEDKTSVVNHKLLVHGVRNFRVVDASIMPVIPGGNTMAATLAVAQKGVDLILDDHTLRNEL